MNDLQYMTYLIYLLGINSWFVLHQPWLWHFLKWNRSIIYSGNVDGIKYIWYKKAFKTLQMYIGNTCYPDNIYASTMFLHAWSSLLWTVKNIWNPTCFNKNIIKLKWFNKNIIKLNIMFVKLWPELVSASWIYISHFFFFIWHTINLT
jgi:hypothetical protein